MQKETITTLGFIGLAVGFAAVTTACKEAEAKVRGPGDSLKAFIIENCSTSERYCQVCAYSGSPTVMAVGDVDDKNFADDLKKIEELYSRHKDEGLTAFALYGKFKDGKLGPVAGDAATLERLASLQKQLGLSFPITVLPKELTAKEAKAYKPFEDAYDVTKSRTVMVAKANNKIVWADVMKGEDTQYTALAGAVKKAL